MCVNVKLIGTNGQAIEWALPDPYIPPKQTVEKSTKWLEVDENVTRAHFRVHMWPVVK